MVKKQWNPLQQIYLLAGKEITGPLASFPPGRADLSRSLERLVLLPVNSRKIHACWTISCHTDFGNGNKEEEGKLPTSSMEEFTLRLYHKRKEDKWNMEDAFLETSINSKTRKSYLAVEPDSEYFAELGILNGDGRFHCRLRSNKIRTPREAPLAESFFSAPHGEEHERGGEWEEKAGPKTSSTILQKSGLEKAGVEMEIFRKLAMIYKGLIDFASFSSIMASPISGSFIEKYLELSQRLKGETDLTALCEKKFRNGISSPSGQD